jgi:hypothetical protein
MAVIQGDIVGVTFFDSHYGGRGFCRIAFTVATYDASADTGKLGSGGTLFGASSSDTLEVMLQKVRRDGKTLNIIAGMPGRAGRDGSTSFYADTVAVSTDDITFEISDVAGTEIDASGTNGADGIKALPMEILVAYDLS